MRQRQNMQIWLKKLPGMVPVWAGLVVLALVFAAVQTYPPLFRSPQGLANETAAFFPQGEDKVAVNTAPVEELLLLPGVGEEKANAIIGWREENGNFTGAQDLLQVPGIGPGTLEKIEGRICF